MRYGQSIQSDRTPLRTWMLAAIGLVVATVVALPPAVLGITVAAILALVLVCAVAFSLLRGEAGPLMVGWSLLFPLGYYFFSVPRAHPLLTLDRVTIVALLVAAAFAGRTGENLPRTLRICGWAWVGFLATATASIAFSANVPSSVRLLVEAFIFPAILVWCVYRCLDVNAYGKWIHASACLMAIYCAAIGVAEVITLQDLLPLGDGSSLFSDTGIGIPRANGPFSTNNSYALIGVCCFLLIRFLGDRHRTGFTWWQRVLHQAGLIGALVMATLPMFRSVLLTVCLIICVEAYTLRGAARWFRVVALAALLTAVASLTVFLPDLFEERVASERNVEARLAQQRQTWEMFAAHPVLGVGFNNFTSAVPGKESYSGVFNGADPLDSPHNNLGAVLAETGIIGFVPYLISQILLVAAFWRLRRNSSIAWNVWICFALVFSTYWLSGMTLTSGYFADLNLWYMFIVAVLYKYASSASSIEHAQVPVRH